MDDKDIPKGIDAAAKLFCGDIEIQRPVFKATLFLDGQLVATGEVVLENGVPCCFFPTSVNSLDTVPPSGATLRVSGKDGELKLKDFARCPSAGSLHYHFRIVS